MDLAREVARLADVGERILERQERQERAQRDRALDRTWGPALPPLARAGTRTYLEAVPGLAAIFDRSVPPEFVIQTGVDELTIACPCGEEPRVRTGRLAGCVCGRWFLADERREVHVALSPLNELSPGSGPPSDPDGGPERNEVLTASSG